MNNTILIKILISIFIVIIMLFMYFLPPTQAEVGRYFDENKCYVSDYCVYGMRRSTGMLFGQIFNVPIWWVLPNFILYTTTPFYYYHEITQSEDEFHTFTYVDTWEGRFVYNAVNGEYVKEIDDKEDPGRKYIEDLSVEYSR